MRISIISDTHNQHEKFPHLSGDVLIHCGDMFNLFAEEDREIERIDEWFGRQDFDLVLCTGGNHDRTLERRLKTSSEPFENAIYLQDRAYAYEGINFYGAPWTPELRGHAFFLGDHALQSTWSQIPEDTDILITHTPPAKILDISSAGLQLGCVHLAKELERIRPGIHCFGHVHASRGRYDSAVTAFVNASSVNSQFDLVHPAYQLDFN